MAIEPLITAEHLRSALGRATYMALFDDVYDGDPSGDVTKVDASADVQLVLMRAHACVVSRLPVIYSKIPDGSDAQVSVLLQHAELLYAEALSYDRHPEYVNRFGLEPVRDGKFKAGEKTMAMIQETILSIVPNDAPPEEVPRDVTGVVVSGTRRSDFNW